MKKMSEDLKVENEGAGILWSLDGGNKNLWGGLGCGRGRDE
jgi:hypothetical protein